MTREPLTKPGARVAIQMAPHTQKGNHSSGGRGPKFNHVIERIKKLTDILGKSINAEHIYTYSWQTACSSLKNTDIRLVGYRPRSGLVVPLVFLLVWVSIPSQLQCVCQARKENCRNMLGSSVGTNSVTGNRRQKPTRVAKNGKNTGFRNIGAILGCASGAWATHR